MDIDLDFSHSFHPEETFKQAIQACLVLKGKLKKHPAGVYFQTIPKDKITGLSAIPYKEAEELGYMKIDFLHLNLLDIFESKAEIRALIKLEPDWTMLENPEIVAKLPQIGKHFDIVKQIKPSTVQDLSDIIALIRPGKRFLLDYYLDNKEMARLELYKKPEDSNKYYFKKSHACAYSFNIILAMHLIHGGLL